MIPCNLIIREDATDEIPKKVIEIFAKKILEEFQKEEELKMK